MRCIPGTPILVCCSGTWVSLVPHKAPSQESVAIRGAGESDGERGLLAAFLPRCIRSPPSVPASPLLVKVSSRLTPELMVPVTSEAMEEAKGNDEMPERSCSRSRRSRTGYDVCG